MGLDSAFYPPPRVKREELEEFLLLLGYQRYAAPKHLKSLKPSSFHYISKRPYEMLQGVTFTVLIHDGKVAASGRNNIWRNKADNDFHNHTLRQLRRRFGGYFEGDEGRNRYFPFDGVDRRDDEAGCHVEAESALNLLKEISVLLHSVEGWKTPIQKGDMAWMNQSHPQVVLANLAVVHIVSVVESYFKNTFIALLTFSQRKSDLVKPGSIRATDLLLVGDGALRLEEAFANGLNFQSADSICKSFDQLDQKLALRQELAKKYGQRTETFYRFIERITSHRHRYVHHAERDWNYDLASLKKDLGFCEILIHRIYKAITERRGWLYEKPF